MAKVVEDWKIYTILDSIRRKNFILDYVTSANSLATFSYCVDKGYISTDDCQRVLLTKSGEIMRKNLYHRLNLNYYTSHIYPDLNSLL